MKRLLLRSLSWFLGLVMVTWGLQNGRADEYGERHSVLEKLLQGFRQVVGVSTVVWAQDPCSSCSSCSCSNCGYCGNCGACGSCGCGACSCGTGCSCGCGCWGGCYGMS
jgi:hypothetical protein